MEEEIIISNKTKDELNIRIIKLYQSGLSMNKVGNEVGLNVATVFNRLKKHGIETRTKGGIYKIPIDEICEKYYGENISPLEISKEYGVSMQTIYNYLHDNDKEIKGMSVYHNPNMNHQYFKNIDSERKSYFLGFIIADGCVHLRYQSAPAISIAIHSRDDSILKVFKDEIKTDNEIYYLKKGRRDDASLTIHSNEMADDLAKYGVVPNKTFTSYLPQNIPKEHMPHLIRGLIDGDGWVSAQPRGIQIGFCGSHFIVEQVRDYLTSEIGVYNVKVIKQGNISSIQYGGNKNSKLIANYIYKDATVYLERKYNKLKEFLSTK